jgi:flagellar basal-body rod protein FlgC
MDFSIPFKICASGLAAQRAKMDVITSNLANVGTTNTPEGGPYKRKEVVLGSRDVVTEFDGRLRDVLQAVEVKEIVEDKKGVKLIYDPTHPDADEKGFVATPNINVVLEMAEMINVNRSYEACATAFDATKNMALKTLDIGK